MLADCTAPNPPVQDSSVTTATVAVDLELRDRADAVAVDGGPPREAEAAAVPAFADGEHDDVGALAQQRR